MNAFLHCCDAESPDAHSGQRGRDGGVTVTVGISLDDSEDLAVLWNPLADLIEVVA